MMRIQAGDLVRYRYRYAVSPETHRVRCIDLTTLMAQMEDDPSRWLPLDVLERA